MVPPTPTTGTPPCFADLAAGRIATTSSGVTQTTSTFRAAS